VNEFGEKMLGIALKLTHISSIVGTAGETLLAETLYQDLQELPYFQNKSELLTLMPIPGDKLGRKYVMAILEGERISKNAIPAILCLGHIDTVGIQDYAELKDYATDSDELKQRLKTIQFSVETLAEIESPDWIFGRGMLDMKTGVAAQLVMLEHFSTRTAELTGNLVFVFVPDEEGDSAGMLAAVREIAVLAKNQNLQFFTAIDTDYTTTHYPGDDHRYVYVGTVGKLLPCFYLYGEETHVGEAFNGVDANLLASEVLYQMDYNTDLCDHAGGEVTLPPVSLYQRDLKTEYSVQTTNAVTMYFNFSTHTSQPAEVLEKCRKVAQSSFDSVIVRLNGQYEKYCLLTHIPFHPLPWETKVLTYEELYQAVKGELGDEIDRIITCLAEKLLAQGVDDREFSLKIVEEVHRHYSNQNSKIIVYFAPPYYAHNYVTGENAKEQALFDALDGAIAAVKQEYSYDVVIKKFYPFISDLSFCNISKDPGNVKRLTRNMPAWGKKYQLPVEAIQSINMPVVNIGPFGKDAHKLSERLSIPYSLDAMPLILKNTIENLLIFWE
jgi:arginine utilization protein RocB